MYKRRIGQILVLGCLLSACGGGGGSVEARNLNSSRDDRAGDSTGGSREGGEEDRRNNESDENRDEDRGDDNGNNAGGGGGIGTQAGDYAVLGFNDLGMHCADLDYSTFVILPPFNVVRSQVIRRGAEPSILDNQQVDVTYQAVADASGSINTTSQNPAGSVFKSNFWEINPDTGRMYVTDLFGLSPQKDEGLLGQRMPGIGAPYSANDPQSFDFQNDGMGWFSADGVPILPVDDAGHANAYPLMRLSAKDKSGNALGSVDVVLPVASEADCQTCHAIGQVGANRAGVDFVFADNDQDPNSILQAAKTNILRLHDAKHSTALDSQRPVLCASCHYSAALDLAAAGPNAEQQQHTMMSQVMHGHHGSLVRLLLRNGFHGGMEQCEPAGRRPPERLVYRSKRA